jgi:hypothetical protein
MQPQDETIKNISKPCHHHSKTSLQLSNAQNSHVGQCCNCKEHKKNKLKKKSFKALN